MRHVRAVFFRVRGPLNGARPRDQRGIAVLETLASDTRFALRLLVRNPGYALAALVALALGIGASTAVFSVVDGVLFKALPYNEPQRLMLVYEQPPGAPNKFGFSPPDFEIVRELARSYSGFAAYQTNGYELSGGVTPERLIGARVSPNLLSVLGVDPLMGRPLTDEDDRQNARIAVVSHGLWTRVFGRDPALLGRSISLDGRSYTVVGIMPERFVFPPRGADLNGEPADVFIPMSFSPFERQAFGMMYNSTVIARLKPGISAEQARAELSSLVAPLTDRYPSPLRQFATRSSMSLTPILDETVGSSRQLLLVVIGSVTLVLLIGCADVAGLVLTRLASRQRELVVRAALGATRQRIVRQLCTEAFVLGTVGSALGLILAYWLTAGLLSLAGNKLPRTESIVFDYRIVLFAMSLAVLTPLVFGIVPAFRAVRGAGENALKETPRSMSFGRQRAWLLGSLVVGQFALALVLSDGAGLLVHSFARLVRTNPGFLPEQTIRATVQLPAGRYSTPPQVKGFYQKSIEAVRGIPGVVAIGTGNDLPLSVRERRAFSADPSARRIPDESRLVAVTWTVGAYLDALRIPLKRGRFLTDADSATSQRVVVVNERLAQMMWPDADPIGRQIRWGIDVPQNQSPWMTIAGVVGDVKQAGLETPAIAQVYVPLAQDVTGANLLRTVNLVVRSSREAASVVTDVRNIVHGLDPSLPVTVQTLEEMVGASVQSQRFSMTVMMLFAGVALILATLGAYGVLSNAVAQQTQEFGVRIALGATRGDVMWMVLRRALMLTAAGFVVGTAGAFLATRMMASLLFEVRPTDTASFLAASASLAAVAVLASLAPAWRATRVDPIIALRAE